VSAALLAALQVADSAFPTGGFAFSWGLETALADGRVDRRSFPLWLETELVQRWRPFDRIAVARAWSGDLAIDDEIDLLLWAEPLRLRSREAGAALLASAARLGVPAPRDELHLPVAQGALFRAMGLTRELALAASAHAAAQALVSAAVRLGAIGALEGQRALAALRPALAEAVAPPEPHEHPAAFAPVSEIAMLRPLAGRLFVN
jgi:urease accessory protein